MEFPGEGLRLPNQKETIRKMVRYLNNPEKDGGFWLPNIQRPFVWREDQIERLFDSIMREYPISTLLVWKTKAAVRRRKFIDNYKHSLKLSDFYVPDDQHGVLWSDRTIGIAWPVREPILSHRDRAYPPLTVDRDDLPTYEPVPL